MAWFDREYFDQQQDRRDPQPPCQPLGANAEYADQNQGRNGRLMHDYGMFWAGRR